MNKTIYFLFFVNCLIATNIQILGQGVPHNKCGFKVEFRSTQTEIVLTEINGEIIPSISNPKWKPIISAVRATQNAKTQVIETVCTQKEFKLINIPMGANIKLWASSNGYSRGIILIVPDTIDSQNRLIEPIKLDCVICDKKNKSLALIARYAINALEYAKDTDDTESVMYFLKILKKEFSEYSNKILETEQELKNLQIERQNISLEELERKDQFLEDVVKRNNSDLDKPFSDINDYYLKYIKDDSMPYDVRQDAIRAFTYTSPTETQKNEALAYFRVQARNPQSDFLIPSLTGLYILGDSTDRKTVTNGILGSDGTISTTSFNALEIALNFANTSKVNDIIAQFKDIFYKKNRDLEVKETAFQSLGNFAKQNQSEKANELLVDVLKDKKELQTTTIIQAIPKEKLTQKHLNEVRSIEQRINSPN